jgi:ATP-dependent Clp protease ATP-binding subunit ClpC
MALDIVFPLGLLHRKIAPGAVLTEALFVPEVSRLAGSSDLSRDSALEVLRTYLAERKPDELIRRRRATAARELRFSMTLDPPRANAAWREPATLTFHAAVWEEAGYAIARVPALGIEVIAKPKDDLTELLRKEALAALRRSNATANLRNLSRESSASAFRIEWTDLTVRLLSLKERAERAEKNEDDDDDKRTTLQKVGTLLKPGGMEPAYEMDEALRPVVDALTAKPPQAVLLVGPSGVGKTALVRELVRRKAALGLADTPFFQTSGSRIVAGQCGFGMWEQRCQELVKDAVRRRAVVHLGSLAELMDVGKSEFNSTGIATFLRPAIARGELLAIAECTPEQLPLIERENPQLPDAFRTVTVEEPDRERGRRILAAAAESLARRPPAPAVLDTIDRLHRRYATYSAYPGRPLRFLANLLRDGTRDDPPRPVDVYDAFARETGLPRSIVDPDDALDLPATRDWFARRVVGQTEAVDLVVDLLATVKAGLTRTNRPIASLLFIGPTGVGKTELAKALAEFLFGSRDRLLRFDMSEFADPVAVRRLVGTGFGTEGLLTAKVREAPFSVLLLDEVEKAHPAAFDLLLQALGEGRLTDAGGRLADFRNTVVILTSNLGAESFRSGTPGFAADTRDAKEHFTRAVEKFLRPELFNRLDRIVPFASLPEDVIRAIAEREWRLVLARDGVRFRDMTVTTGDGLLDHLAAIGFDDRYGARPLKRAMERELLAPLARQVNRHGGATPLLVDVGMRDGAPYAAARPVQGAAARPDAPAETPLGAAALAAPTQRRWHQLLARSTVLRELENTVTQLVLRERRLQGRRKRGQALGKDLQEVLAELGRLRGILDEVRDARAEAERIEDDALAAFYGSADAGTLPDRVAAAEKTWDQLLLRLYALEARETGFICLHFFAESATTRADLANAYRVIARQQGLAFEVVRYRLPGEQPPIRDSEQRPVQSKPKHPAKVYWHEDQLFSKAETPHRIVLWRERVPGDFDPTEQADTIGFGFQFHGAQAHLRFSAEAGWHQFDKPQPPDADTPDALVFASSDPLEAFLPDEKLARKGAIGGERARRTYNRAKGTVCDFEWIKLQSGPFLFQTAGDFTRLLSGAIDRTVRVRLLQMVVE